MQKDIKVFIALFLLNLSLAASAMENMIKIHKAEDAEPFAGQFIVYEKNRALPSSCSIDPEKNLEIAYLSSNKIKSIYFSQIGEGHDIKSFVKPNTVGVSISLIDPMLQKREVKIRMATGQEKQKLLILLEKGEIECSCYLARKTVIDKLRKKESPDHKESPDRLECAPPTEKIFVARNGITGKYRIMDGPSDLRNGESFQCECSEQYTIEDVKYIWNIEE